ncbi:unnamed protein product [Vicia faba]|uniref:Uncharacterized protein n=1 Tax=Vicia faba TaxID=3906 RepID=A0AAV1AJ16_VICFA|nr:unnamed protein product [Vicia faba]
MSSAVCLSSTARYLLLSYQHISPLTLKLHPPPSSTNVVFALLNLTDSRQITSNPSPETSCRGNSRGKEVAEDSKPDSLTRKVEDEYSSENLREIQKLSSKWPVGFVLKQCEDYGEEVRSNCGISWKTYED